MGTLLSEARDLLVRVLQPLLKRDDALLGVQAAVLQTLDRRFEGLNPRLGCGAGFALAPYQLDHTQHALLERIEIVGGKGNLGFFNGKYRHRGKLLGEMYVKLLAQYSSCGLVETLRKSGEEFGGYRAGYGVRGNL